MDTTTTQLPSEMEIFRAGTYTAMDGSKLTVSAADLAAIADRYDPAAAEAPLVVGHPQINAPAYGWVQSLRAEGDLLFAAPHQVDAAFAALVRKGAFKKRSASFFRPGSAGNPTPDALYLRHVGFLGAAAPGVPGLRDASFSADADACVVEFSAPESRWAFRSVADMLRRWREYLIQSVGAEKADEIAPNWQIDSIAEAARDPAPSASLSFASQENPLSNPNPQANADFAARETALGTREQQLAAREAALRAAEVNTRRAGVVEFCAGLVQQGRLLPAHQPQIVELLVNLGEQPQTLNFAASDGSQAEQGAVDALRGFLSAMPVQVDMGEHGGGADPVTVANFAAPAGAMVSRDRAELDAQAQQYMRQNPNTGYLDAVRAVGG